MDEQDQVTFDDLLGPVDDVSGLLDHTRFTEILNLVVTGEHGVAIPELIPLEDLAGTAADSDETGIGGGEQDPDSEHSLGEYALGEQGVTEQTGEDSWQPEDTLEDGAGEFG